MKTWTQFIEGQDDFNNPGVPHYAPSKTPSPVPDHYPSDEPRIQAQMRADANKMKFRDAVGKRFRAKEGGYIATKFGIGATGIITKVGGLNFSYQMDAVPGKTFTYSVASMPFTVELE